MYAYRTSEIFLQTKHLKFYFKKRNHFRDGMTRLVINTRLFTNSQKCSYAQNNWVFFIYAFCTLWLNALQKVSLCILWKMVLFVHNFQNGSKFRTLRNVSIYFLLFYWYNIMLKLILCWIIGNHIEKRMHKKCGEIFSGFCRKAVRISESFWTACCEINDFKPHSFPIF